jgi:hypothetical protein
MRRFKDQIVFSDKQKEEIGKFSLDISKLIFASWFLGLFVNRMTLPQVLLSLVGLMFSGLFFILGISTFKEIK